MMENGIRETVETLLDRAGITINGNNPYDIQVRDENFYARLLSDGALGLGESYMEGWWDCDAIDQLIEKARRAELHERMKGNGTKVAWHYLKSKVLNLQNGTRAYQVGEQHYDVGNDLYEHMLGKTMAYTCAFWHSAKNLDEAQEAKFDLVCRKLNLQPGMTVLELGCGFGSFALFAAKHYGVSVKGVTVSREQVKWAQDRCKGLPIQIELEDYRNVTGLYDRVISIGLMEHVGYKNYRSYMETVHRTLKDDGIAFIHTIGGNRSVTAADAWTCKYIFPNGMIPSIAQIGVAMEGLFVMEDWHNFGPDYDKTLMAWYENFERAWPTLRGKYSDEFYRMWRLYLLGCAGSFRSRLLQLWQIVMTKQGNAQPVCRFR